jgi:hypothetical protein
MGGATTPSRPATIWAAIALAFVIACAGLTATTLALVHTKPFPVVAPRRTLSFSEFRRLQAAGHLPARHTAGGVPRWVFRTAGQAYGQWTPRVGTALASFEQPGWVQAYATSDECQAFVREEYPQYAAEYDVLVPGAFRADVWRLLCLLHYGGVYADIGMLMRDSATTLEDVLLDASFVGSQDQAPAVGIMQGFLATRGPGAPLVQAFVDRVVHNIRGRLYGSSSLNITGPTSLTEPFNAYMGFPAGAPIRAGAYTSPDGSDRVRMLKYKSFVIRDAGGRRLLWTKFPGYYQEMYGGAARARGGDAPRCYYRRLWDARSVFRDDAAVQDKIAHGKAPEAC